MITEEKEKELDKLEKDGLALAEVGIWNMIKGKIEIERLRDLMRLNIEAIQWIGKRKRIPNPLMRIINFQREAFTIESHKMQIILDNVEKLLPFIKE